MHTLESFSAVANIFNAPRKVTFDSLTGLKIEGLDKAQAQAIVELLERIDGALEQRLRPARTMPDGRPNRARWQTQPKPTDVTVASDEGPQPPPVEETCPQCEETAAPPDTVPDPSPAEQPRMTLVRPLGIPPVTEWEDAPPSAEEDPVEVSEYQDDDTTEELPEPVRDVQPENPPPQPKEERHKWRPGMKAPPRPEELTRMNLPKKGDKHEGVEIVEVKEYGDGRTLVRADGWRIKINLKGVETARVEGMPPSVSDVATAAPAAEESSTAVLETSENAEQPPSNTVPEKIMQSRMTRDVILWLLDTGVQEKEAIIAECLKLKESGALAFEASKDEEAVRRRVNSTLMVMGRA